MRSFGRKKAPMKNRTDEGSSESEQEADDDKSSNSDQLCTDNSPKVIPICKLPDQLRTKKIIINISDTQYPIIQDIAEELGWVVQSEEGIGDWDIWWTDHEVNPDTLFRMHLYQKLNHFPGIYVLARKNLLGMNLMAMREKFADEYNFFPETWVLPLEFPKFQAYFDSCPKGKTRTYIVKPEALSQGRGIFLTRSIQDLINGQKYVVQRYLKNPFLIDGLKFDLRIYVLLAGTDPLRLYIYEEGLTRFATKKYQMPTDENLQSSYIHLTNYSLNKNNPDYIYNQSSQKMDVGHKRNLASTFEYLKKQGHDVELLKSQIHDVIIKTVIAGLPPISHQYRYCQPEEYEGNMCFHILGVDVMLTDDLNPFVIEINHTPSFETSTPLDEKVKKGLIMDTLQLMRINLKNKKSLFEKSKQIVKKRIQTGRREIVKGEMRAKMIQEAQKIRNTEQEGQLGGFTKIYPPDEKQVRKKYQKMMEHSQKIHKDTHQVRKKLIREEQDKMKIKRKQNLCTQQFNKTTRNNSNPLDNRKTHTRNGSTNFNNSQYNSSNKPTTAFYPMSQQLKFPHNAQFPVPPKQQSSQIFHGHSINLLKEREEDLPEFQTISKKINERYVNNNKNCGFRMKTKKVIVNAQHKEDLARFSDFMIRYLNTYSVNGSEIDQQTFSSLKKMAERKRKEVCNRAAGIFTKEKPEKKVQKQADGTFVAPKMYHIIDEQRCSIMNEDAIHNKKNPKAKANGNGNGNMGRGFASFESHRMKVLESYQNIYKRKRKSVA